MQTRKAIIVAPHYSFCLRHDSATDLWNLSAWGVDEGYPHHVTFYQSRLVFSGTEDDAASLYLSEYQKFHNFSPASIPKE